MEEKKKKTIIIGAIAIIIVAVVALTLILVKGSTGNEIKITNLKDSLPEKASDELIKNIQADVYKQVESDLGKEKASIANGVVRSGSNHVFINEGKSHSGKFIVDMDSIKQSYLVYYAYDDDRKISSGDMGEFNGASLFCLSNSSDIIYPESACNKGSKATNQSELYLYLPPYVFALDDGRNVTLSFLYKNEVVAIVDQCNAEVDKSAIVKKAEEWVKGYELDVADFKFSIPLNYDNCLMR